jgi:hypothetical protein
MGKAVDWFESRIDENRALGHLQPSRVRTCVQALAEALASLEAGGGAAFGMHVDGGVVAEHARLAPLLRDALEGWERKLVAEFGEKGTATFRTIVGRFGDRLWERGELRGLSQEEGRILQRVTSELPDIGRLTREWRKDDELMEPDEVVHVEIGRPDPRGLDTLADKYTQKTEAPFPPLLHALWSRMNGIAIYASSDTVVNHYVMCEHLSEPILWPVNSYGEHWWEADTDGHLFVIGALADSGHIALRVVDADHEPEVVWLGRGAAPFPLAPSFAAFLDDWASAAFRIQSLLRRARVPGWGA